MTGYYCVNATITPTICPVGHYCPKNTEFDQHYPCPPGTYFNQTGQEILSIYCIEMLQTLSQ